VTETAVIDKAAIDFEREQAEREVALEADLTAILDDLGASPESVTCALLQLGHKGKRVRPDACPLARYVLAELAARRPGEAFEVSVDEHTTTAFGRHLMAFVETPPACEEFIDAFDKGTIPQLVEDGA
jgi:hypothetical protein